MDEVALWGFGAMGSGIAKVLLRKKGVDIVGVCDIHPARVGRSIYELLEIDRGSRDDVLVNPKIEEVVHDGNCDICVIATDSFTRKAFNKIKFVVEQNVNVVSTAEEMSFPMAQEPELSAERQHGFSGSICNNSSFNSEENDIICYLFISRWNTLLYAPFSSKCLLINSAKTTERCLPPVQPTAMVSWLLPSLRYSGRR